MTTSSGEFFMTVSKEKATGRYKYVGEEKAGGVTFTPTGLASFVARQIVSNLNSPKREPLRIIDPAVGEGTLLLSLVGELASRGFRNPEIHGFDTNAESLSVAECALKEKFPGSVIRFRVGDFLEFAGETARRWRSLFADRSPERFDAVIANPPYVRTQIMGASQAQRLASHFGLKGRVDLYYAFILGIIEVLHEDGVAGVIVSNRFMTTKSGMVVRRALRDSVCLKHVWDLGDTKLFEAAVLPAVLVMTKGRPAADNGTAGFTSIYETDAPAEIEVSDVIAALDKSGSVGVRGGRRFRVTHGRLDVENGLDQVWRVATDKGNSWLQTVEMHTWRKFGDLGNIRVGIKTCADQVFIKREADWHGVPESERPELVRPLTTHHVGRRFRADATKGPWWVVYPHVIDEGRRGPADLRRYPRTAAYLEEHRRTLEGRSYVIEAGRRWYEIWVPQDPGAWSSPKLVFRDICEVPTFWLDLDGNVVNGDCYWLSLKPGMEEDVLWLALAVANSSFIEEFYDQCFHNKLYAGRRRFMTQYVEQFPLPDPSTEEARMLVAIAKRIYDQTPSVSVRGLESQLNSLVRRAFGVSVEEVFR
ncbi:MAG TPA: N-6 DNA methylase [Terriglobia bacterium]|nr:N-6 DNA methylase [Terriglobia bacterium]